MTDPRGDDRFYVHHPDFERFLLHFGRDAGGDDQRGVIVEAMHGPAWYVKESYTGPREYNVASAWQRYPGHYRSHNSWQTNFRVVIRKGALWRGEPDGDEEPLFPHREHEFCIGDKAVPERLRFSQFVNGEALCATRSECDFYRFFTP